METAKTQAQYIRAYNDIWAFCDLIGFKGGRKNFGAVHKDLAEFITTAQDIEHESNRRRLVLMPRGHLKSSVCSVLYTLWRIYRNPDIRILVATNIKRLGRAFIRELRQYFENGELQRKVWNTRPWCPGPLIPALSAADRRTRNSQRSYDTEDDLNLAQDSKLIWSMEALQVIRPSVMKEPTVAIVSVSTTVTGDHYDLLILDDVVDFDNSSTEAKADSILDWTRDLESVLDPRQQVTRKAGTFNLVDNVGDEAIILGTRYFEWDFYGYLLAESEALGIRSFIKNIYVNGYDDTDGYIWPEKFDAHAINSIRKRINSTQRFASQYLNTILAPEDQLFNIEQITWFSPATLQHLPDNTWEVYRVGNPARRVKPILFVDPAATVNSSSDFTVLTVAGYSEERELCILDIDHGRYTPDQVCERIFKMCDTWGINSVTVEMVAGFRLYETVIRNYMKRHSRLIGIRDYRPTTKMNKRARIEGMLLPLLENKMVLANSTIANNEEFRNELTLFPKSKHDDILDTLAAIAEIASPTRKTNAKGAYTPRRVINTKWGGTYA